MEVRQSACIFLGTQQPICQIIEPVTRNELMIRVRFDRKKLQEGQPLAKAKMKREPMKNMARPVEPPKL